MLYPVIDIGSNTVKIAVLDEEHLFRQAPMFFKAVPLNIKSKVSGGILPEKDVEELAKLILSFREIAGRLTKNEPIAFATASLRGLGNMDQILARIREVSGVKVEVISGETEAYYSFLGAKGCISAKSGVSVDLGGGSTELLAFQKNKVVQAVSLPFGCLTLYHAFYENEGNHEACRAFIREHLEKNAPSLGGNSLLLSGGSAKAVLRYKNYLEKKKNFTLPVSGIRHVLTHFESGDPKEKKKVEEVLKDRFRLIPPACAIFEEILSFYRKESAHVCRSGVREGCLYHHLQEK